MEHEEAFLLILITFYISFQSFKFFIRFIPTHFMASVPTVNGIF